MRLSAFVKLFMPNFYAERYFPRGMAQKGAAALAFECRGRLPAFKFF